MNASPESSVPAKNRVLTWTGRGISTLIVLLLTMSGVMKFQGGPEMDEGLKKMGLPKAMVVPLAVVELTCTAIYAIPQTSILGAILLTGYMGGAICTHWRVGDVFVLQIVIGVLIWLGIFFREPKLRKLIPWRG